MEPQTSTGQTTTASQTTQAVCKGEVLPEARQPRVVKRDPRCSANTANTMQQVMGNMFVDLSKVFQKYATVLLSQPISFDGIPVATAAFQVHSSQKTPKRRKRKRDPERPKRPLSAYQLFMQDHLDECKTQHPNENYMKQMAAMWKEVDDKAREPYRQKAGVLKAEHTKAIDGYMQRKKMAGAKNKPIKVLATVVATAVAPGTTMAAAPRIQQVDYLLIPKMIPPVASLIMGLTETLVKATAVVAEQPAAIAAAAIIQEKSTDTRDKDVGANSEGKHNGTADTKTT